MHGDAVPRWRRSRAGGFCGPITDNSDRVDYQMARDYLARHIANPLQAAAELVRFRDAAQRLVRSPWAQHALSRLPTLCCGTASLSADEIFELIA